MDSRQAGVRPYVLFCALVASLGTFNSGVNTSSMNIPGSYVRNCTPDPAAPLPLCIPMNDWVWGAATGMYPVGGLLGALVAGPLARRFGRRDAMMFLNSVFVVGAALISTSTTSAQFGIGRIFTGIGSGFMTVVIPMYISEISPPKQRGALVSLLQLLTTFGILFIEVVGLGLRSAVGWRVSAVITVAPAAIQAVLLPFCARSPRWLLSQKRVDEARTQLVRLRKGDIESEFADMSASFVAAAASAAAAVLAADPNDLALGVVDQQSEADSVLGTTALATKQSADRAQEEKTDLQQEDEQQQKQLSLAQVFRVRVLAVLLVKMVILHACSQLSGINSIMYYSTSIFERAFGDAAAYVTIGVAGINMMITVVGLALIDKLGRKMLVLISCVTMCAASGIMTVGLRLDIAVLQVLCIMLFVAGFGIGLGIVPFLYTPECFPTYAVDVACSVALVVNWLCNFIIGFIFPTLTSACGDYVFLIFTAITFLFAFFFSFAFIETKRKSIDDIGRELGWYGLDVDKILSRPT